MLLTRCITVEPQSGDCRGAEQLALRFGEGPVFLQWGTHFVFVLDVRVDARRVCEEERYSYCELYEDEMDASKYNRQHRVDPPLF